MLLKGRIVWPTLFEPKNFQGEGEKKYSCSLLIPKDDPQIEGILKTLKKIIDDDLGGKQPEERYWPVKDGDKADNEAYAGNWEFRLKNTRKPGVVDQNLDPIIDPDYIRGGDYVNVDVHCFAYTRNFRGIGLSLNNVQFVSKGEQIIGSAKRPEDVFEPIGDSSGEQGAVNDFLSG